MKMKHFSLIAGAAFAALVFAGCPDRRENTLVVWVFTDEIGQKIEMHGIAETLGMGIDVSLTPSDQFQGRLDPALRAGRRVAPDVFTLESAFVRRYIESGLLLDLTELYEEVSGRVLPYPVEIATYGGRVYGMSWQATPGAMFFRRSLALEYLGTDDPAEVQEFFADWELFMETALSMNEASGGRVAVISAVGDLNHPFRSARSQPWIVDGQLYIDPAMIDYMRMARFLRYNSLDGRVDQWSTGWFDGMRGTLTDGAGNPVPVFAYFLPTWGIHYTLRNNAPLTHGDWGMIPGPVTWFWGGTWLAAYAETRHPEAAKEFIRQVATNEANIYRWARETGDFLNNVYVMNRILADDSPAPSDSPVAFLGGQNHFEIFMAMAPYVDGSKIQGTDQAIDSLFLEAVTQYVNGEAAMEQALAMFREQVRAQLGF